MHAPHVMSGGRYPVLRALAIMYVLVAGLIAAGAILFAAYALVAARFAWTDKMILFAGALASGFILVVSALAAAELLKLLIDIEHNTRMSIPGRIGMPAPVETVGNDGGAKINRITALDEETAEAALIRGH